jgi:PadR family transcriptional regulator PadR
VAKSKELSMEELLANWEEVYKKGLLSFWLLLLLNDGPSYAYEVARSIEAFSQSSISADENSIYRALNRFESLGILRSEIMDSDIGPNRRYYRLTEKGIRLLRNFIRRNVLVFEEPMVKDRIINILNMPDNGIMEDRK